MKVEGYLFALLALFFIPVTAVYWYYSDDPTSAGSMIQARRPASTPRSVGEQLSRVPVSRARGRI